MNPDAQAEHNPRQRKYLIIVPGVLLACLLALTLGRTFFSSDPINEQLDQWLPHLDHPERREKYSETRDALRRIGTNAFPRLVRMMSRNDSSLKERTINYARRKGLLRSTYVPQEREHSRALAAFRIIGPQSVQVLPALEKAITTNNFRYIVSVATTFKQEECKRFIVRQASRPQDDMRAYAIYCLRPHLDDKAVFELVHQRLNDESSEVRLQAARLFCGTDRDISACLPALTRLAETDSSSEVRGFAQCALRGWKQQQEREARERERQALIKMARPPKEPEKGAAP